MTSEALTPGDHFITLDVGGLPLGVYSCEVRTDGRREMLIARVVGNR